MMVMIINFYILLLMTIFVIVVLTIIIVSLILFWWDISCCTTVIRILILGLLTSNIIAAINHKIPATQLTLNTLNTTAIISSIAEIVGCLLNIIAATKVKPKITIPIIIQPEEFVATELTASIVWSLETFESGFL